MNVHFQSTSELCRKATAAISGETSDSALMQIMLVMVLGNLAVAIQHIIPAMILIRAE